MASEIPGNQSEFAYTYAFLAMAYAAKGEDAKARAAAAELRRLDPRDVISVSERECAKACRIQDGLRANLFRRGARQGCRNDALTKRPSAEAETTPTPIRDED